MRLIVYIFLLLLIPITLSAQQIKYPHSPFHIQAIYQLQDGNKIYIEQYEHGDIIWQQDSKTGKFTKLAKVWSFIALAKSCESIDKKNIYFATNKENYLMGGIVEDPTIRIFDLNNKHPWRDSDLGIVPNMEWTKQWCEFYSELKN